MIRKLDQWLCGLVTGHTFIPTRVWEESKGRYRYVWVCEQCHARREGWIVDGSGPRKRFDGDPERHRIGRAS